VLVVAVPERRTPRFLGWILTFTGYEMSEFASASVRSNRQPVEDLTAGPASTFFQPFFENVPVGTALLDPQGRVLRANQEFTRIFGFPVDDLLGLVLDELIVPEGLRGEAVALERRTHRGEPVSVETVRVARDGSHVDVALSGIPVQVGGSFVGSYAIFRDISQQKRTEAERNELLAEVRRVHAGAAAAAQRRAVLLGSVDELLQAPAHPEMLLKRLTRVLVPELADSCIIYLRTAEGGVRRLEVAFEEAAQETLLRRQLNHYPADMEHLIPPVARVLLTGESQLIPEVSIGALKAIPGDTEHVSVALLVGLSSLLVVPIQTGGRTFGAISLGLADSGRRFRADDLALAKEVAARASSLVGERPY
jgi:PAS domain S-box-containing protein